ncbi:MAG TPA: F0F1 ATP synthase subunit delta [Candidatus Paceibacterota bacterium]
MEKEYAQALMRQVASGADERTLVEGLVAHLKREGRMKLLPGILRELKALDARRAKLAPSVEVASDWEAAHAIAAARTMGIEAPAATVNPSLIKGWRARTGGTLVDRSAKQALVDLYQRITN